MKSTLHSAILASAMFASAASSGIAQDYITDFTSAENTLNFNFAQYHDEDIWSMDTSSVGMLNISAAMGAIGDHVDPPEGVASKHLPEWSGQDFVLSTTFALENRGVDAWAGAESTLGFGILSGDAEISAAFNPELDTAPAYIAELTINTQDDTLGFLNIRNFGSDQTDFTGADRVGIPGGVENGEVYELRVTGTYDAGTLSMELAVYDREGNLLVAQDPVTDSTPLAGEYFGLRHRHLGGTQNLDIDYYRFSVTQDAPAPAALPLSKVTELTNLNPARGEMFHSATDGLQFTVEVGGGRTVGTGDIELFLNGEDVTGNLLFSGASPSIGVSYDELEAGKFYSATVVVRDGEEESVHEWGFDTLSEDGAVVIEAEDYNFAPSVDCPGNGLADPGSVGGAYIDDPVPSVFDGVYYNRDDGGEPVGYVDRVGVPGVDYHSNFGDTAVAGETAFRWCDPVKTQLTYDAERAKFEEASSDAGVPIPDYHRHNVEEGEWQNYTRTFPEGDYHVYLRAATTSGNPSIQLDRVTSDPSAPDQTTSFLGIFEGGQSGQYEYVPLFDEFGQQAILSLSGEDTLRLTSVESGSAIDLNFMVLMPAAEHDPYVVSTTPENGALSVAPSGSIEAVLANGTSDLDPDSIELFLNNEPVEATLTSTVAGYEVAYAPAEPLGPGQNHTARIEFDDMAGTGPHSAEWSFSIQLSFPYTNDFTEAGMGETSHTDPGPEFRFDSSEGVLNYNRPDGGTIVSNAAIHLDDIPSDGFVVSSHFTINDPGLSWTDAFNTLGLAILANEPTFEQFYEVSVSASPAEGGVSSSTYNVGALTVRRNRNPGFDPNGGWYTTDVPLLDDGVKYELRVTGTYNEEGHLTLFAAIYRGGLAVGPHRSIVDEDPLEGSYFGIRNRFVRGSTDIDFHDFKVVALSESPDPPSIVSTTPVDQELLAPSTTPIEVVVESGSSPLDVGEIALFLNNEPVGAEITVEGDIVTVAYQPETPLGFEQNHTVRVELDDEAAGGPYSYEWSFAVQIPAKPFPYSNDFTQAGFDYQFHQNDSQFELDTENGIYRYTRPNVGGAAASVASVRLDGVAGEDFLLTNRFTMNDQGLTTDPWTINEYIVALFGENPDFSGTRYALHLVASPTTNSEYNLDAGDMNFRFWDSGDLLEQTGWTNNEERLLNPGVEYEVRVMGTYNDLGHLTVVAGTYQDGIQVGDTRTATYEEPLTGTYFGFHHRFVEGSAEIDTHEFSIQTIPTAKPDLEIAREDGQIVLIWSEGDDVELETALDLSGPWTVVDGAESPYVVDPTAERQFFRLRLSEF